MFKVFKRIRLIFNIKKFIPFLFDFFTLKEISLWKKLLSIGAIVGYFWLPLDIIPDFLSIVGLVDDVTILLLIFQQIIKLAPRHLREKHRLLDE